MRFLSDFIWKINSSSATVTYTLQVTSTSEGIGSTYGGTYMIIKGVGFGTNCSELEVMYGKHMKCEIETCTDIEIKCITRPASVNHVVMRKFKIFNFIILL